MNWTTDELKQEIKRLAYEDVTVWGKIKLIFFSWLKKRRLEKVGEGVNALIGHLSNFYSVAGTARSSLRSFTMPFWLVLGGYCYMRMWHLTEKCWSLVITSHVEIKMSIGQLDILAASFLARGNPDRAKLFIDDMARKGEHDVHRIMYLRRKIQAEMQEAGTVRSVALEMSDEDSFPWFCKFTSMRDELKGTVKNLPDTSEWRERGLRTVADAHEWLGQDEEAQKYRDLAQEAAQRTGHTDQLKKTQA